MDRDDDRNHWAGYREAGFSDTWGGQDGPHGNISISGSVRGFHFLWLTRIALGGDGLGLGDCHADPNAEDVGTHPKEGRGDRLGCLQKRHRGFIR
ncbi:MAG: hypothetical protein WAM66_01800 [Acidobacteriaceae bacterium]